MENLLEVKNLTKKYKNKSVVDNISFNVSAGEVIGLLGVNGAGKSTTINMLSSILQPSSGQILYLGQDICNVKKEYKKNLGVVPQEIALYEDISAWDNMKYFAGLYGIEKINVSQVCQEILEKVDLLDKKFDLPKTYSGGMKRRLNIAIGLLHNPKLIIMDEPTVGVDIQSRNFILTFIEELKNKGSSIIYTTHYLEEVEKIADKIILINRGRIIEQGSLDQIKHVFNGKKGIKVYLSDIPVDLTKELEQVKYICDCNKNNNVLEIYFENVNINHVMTQFFSLLKKTNCEILGFDTINKSLEDIFLNLTDKKEI